MSQAVLDFPPQRKIYSVSELSQQIRVLLEKQFLDVWVTGEISNYRAAGSGHCYFTLKDGKAQIRAVCFRNQARYLRFKPEDGISVIARGRVSVYEARGEYQICVEYLEPAGLGALQLAFEQLKRKLAAEGLFESARKRPLPRLPGTIGIVTSPTGAVIRDILRVLHRRFPNMNVVIYPVRVQGEGAAEEIVAAIQHFSRDMVADVLIVARGGGSIEDLWAFNEEIVARAIVDSRVPVISGVGHETDFTIADFVADLRAPTPSAAAELAVQAKQDLLNDLGSRTYRLAQVLRLLLSEARERFAELRMHRVFQTLAARLSAKAQRVDEAITALERPMRERLNTAWQRCIAASTGVAQYNFRRLVGLKRAALDERQAKLEADFRRYLVERRNRLHHLGTILVERSPHAILRRGYSITRDASGKIIRDASTVAVGSDITVRLFRGQLGATVRDKNNIGEDKS
jgi:exodeoxyribonuclease VII large subunit